MQKSNASQTPPPGPARRGIPQAAGASPSRPSWHPIDFEGDDTSLTQDHLVLLK